jgi:hypothetical protein
MHVHIITIQKHQFDALSKEKNFQAHYLTHNMNRQKQM